MRKLDENTPNARERLRPIIEDPNYAFFMSDFSALKYESEDLSKNYANQYSS